MNIGQACIKTAGREAGQICAVIDTVDDSFVLISGPRVRRKRCNVKHLEIVPKKLALKKGASDSEVIDALVKVTLLKKGDIPVKRPPKEKKEQITAPRKTEVKKEKPEKKKMALPKISLKKKPKEEKKAEKTEKKSAKKAKK